MNERLETNMNRDLKKRFTAVTTMVDALNLSIADVVAYCDVVNAINEARHVQDNDITTTEAVDAWFEDGDAEACANAQRVLGNLFLRNVPINDRRIDPLLD